MGDKSDFLRVPKCLKIWLSTEFGRVIVWLIYKCREVEKSDFEMVYFFENYSKFCSFAEECDLTCCCFIDKTDLIGLLNL